MNLAYFGMPRSEAAFFDFIQIQAAYKTVTVTSIH